MMDEMNTVDRYNRSADACETALVLFNVLDIVWKGIFNAPELLRFQMLTIW